MREQAVAESLLSKRKWFQVTQVAACSPACMLGLNVALGNIALSPVTRRKILSHLPRQCFRDSLNHFPIEADFSKRPFTRPFRLFRFQNSRYGVDAPGLFLQSPAEILFYPFGLKLRSSMLLASGRIYIPNPLQYKLNFNGPEPIYKLELPFRVPPSGSQPQARASQKACRSRLPDCLLLPAGR